MLFILNNNVIIYTIFFHICISTATGMVKTARWLIDSDLKGTLVKMKDNNGDTAAHDAADNG